MALFDFTNDEDIKRSKLYLSDAWKNGKKVEITAFSELRTLKQNSYLHVILSFVSIELGESLQYVKDNYYKIGCNTDIYVEERQDKYIGYITVLRSSKDLNVDEMRISIERFRNWCSKELGIYIPSSEEKDKINEIRFYLKKNSEYFINN